MKIKKIVPIILCLSMLMGNIVPVFAADIKAEPQQMEISMEKGITYTYTIPKKLTLPSTANEQGEYEVDYTVTIQGDLGEATGISTGLTKTQEATLNSGSKTPIKVSMNVKNQKDVILQDVVKENRDDVITVSAADMSQGYSLTYTARVKNKEDLKTGTYNGTLVFNVSIIPLKYL